MLKRSSQGQGVLKNSSQIELDSWRRSILLMIYFWRNMVFSMENYFSGLYYQEAPKGKFCMKQDITSVYEDHHIQYKTMALVSIFLYGVGFVFFLHQSYKIKYSNSNIERLCPKKNIFWTLPKKSRIMSIQDKSFTERGMESSRETKTWWI